MKPMLEQLILQTEMILPYDCIIPCAGASSRMGAFKPLLPFAGTTLVEHAVEKALKLGLRVILVTGNNASAVEALFSKNSQIDAGRLVLAHNANWESGMVSSLQCAVKQVQADYFFVVPADMPFIEPKVFLSLIELQKKSSLFQIDADRLESSEKPKVFFPRFEGKTGHPVLIPASLKNGILDFTEKSQLKPFLLQQNCVYLDLDTDSILVDLDTRDDYKRYVTN